VVRKNKAINFRMIFKNTVFCDGVSIKLIPFFERTFSTNIASVTHADSKINGAGHPVTGSKQFKSSKSRQYFF
jgi:hypothetical protein